MSRHTSLPVRALRSGTLTPEQRKQVKDVRPRLTAWEGGITYLHARLDDGADDRRTAQVARRGLCDVAVIDYLEKVAPSPPATQDVRRECHSDGANLTTWNNSKVFAGGGIPVVMVAQMNKLAGACHPTAWIATT